MAVRESSRPTFMTPVEVCDLVPGMTTTLLQDLRKRGKGPRYYKPTPKVVVYEEADVIAWVRDSVVGTRDQS